MSGVTSAVVFCAIILSTASSGAVSAYTTPGASGRSLEVLPGFTVNRDYLARAGTLCRSTQMLEGFAGVTIHETSNWRSGANAKMHALYLRDGGQNFEVSWHYSVDSTSAYQSIPESEKAWHAGDTSKGTGNARTIAIEICDYNDDGNFDQAMANAEWLAADILYRHGVYTTKDYLFQHNQFSSYGKNCPITIRDTGRWDEFCAKTQIYLDQMVAAKGKMYFSDADNHFTFSGTLPAGFSTSRVDVYSEEITWVGSTPASNNTFTFELEPAYFTAGWHTLRFAAVQSDGSASWTTFTFLVGPPSIVCIDTPSIYGTVYGDFTVQGWAVSHAGVARVDIYADDNQFIGSVNNLSERSDVNATYNKAGKYIGGLNSGFSITIPDGVLSVGAHVIRAEAFGNDGSVQKTSRKIYFGGTLPTYPDPQTDTASVTYQSHIQDIGWQGWVKNSEVSGTSGQSKRMEGVRIFLSNVEGGIEYCTHVQDIGWMDWVSGGNVSGTSGQSKRLEAIRIRLTGNAEAIYDVYYRVHAQDTGWMDWAKNGESAGTAGFSYRLEAIQIVLVPKGGEAPGFTGRPFIERV